MVWLTGGTLALCLVMILGLLVFVFIRGFLTFWPQPVEKVELYNGSVYMGENTRGQWYTPQPNWEKSLPQERREKAVAQAKANDGQIYRRLFYTGNYDLTNSRNLWIDEYDIQSQSKPQWALVVERLEWGRFYGFPQAFEILTERTAPQDEQQLQQLLTFIESHAPDKFGSEIHFDSSTWQDIKPQIASLRQELQKVRSKNVEIFLQNFKSSDADTIQVDLKNSQAKTIAEVNSQNDSITAVREIWEGEPTAYALFESHHAARVAAREQRRYLEEHGMGANSQTLEDARLEVRQAELDYDVALLAPINMAEQLKLNAVPFEKRIRQAEDVALVAREHFGDTPLAHAVRKLSDQLASRIRRQKLAPLLREANAHMTQMWQAPEPAVEVVRQYLETQHNIQTNNARIREAIDQLNAENERFTLIARTAQDQQKRLRVAEVVRLYPANQLSWFGKWDVYLSRWFEFLTANPREANMEGGVFPAIFGTVLMTMLMCILVVPFGVLAALYLREYAKAGPIISAVRISINNLAGVPSIVFGVFGLGFFIYVVGAYIDGGPNNAFGTELAPPYWWAALVYATLSSVVGGVLFAMSSSRQPKVVLTKVALAVGSGLLAIGALVGPWAAIQSLRSPLLIGLACLVGIGLAAAAVLAIIALFCSFQRPFARQVLSWQAAILLTVAFVGVLVVVALVPFFEGFFQARLSEGSPTFGKTALIWASFTLALLTLPVVIVATEEALAAVPNSMREGSYACGASKWQTIRRIVLPRALPGIMTGAILAMARGAGEVAPLMLVGAVKLAPELPFSIYPSEQFGINRSFMHLGFHIFDVGFQSPDSEAARPMVFTTTLLLILIVLTLNVSAIFLRSRLRRKFQGSAF